MYTNSLAHKENQFIQLSLQSLQHTRCHAIPCAKSTTRSQIHPDVTPGLALPSLRWTYIYMTQGLFPLRSGSTHRVLVDQPVLLEVPQLLNLRRSHMMVRYSGAAPFSWGFVGHGTSVCWRIREEAWIIPLKGRPDVCHGHSQIKEYLTQNAISRPVLIGRETTKPEPPCANMTSPISMGLPAYIGFAGSKLSRYRSSMDQKTKVSASTKTYHCLSGLICSVLLIIGRNFHLSSFHPGFSDFPDMFGISSGGPASSHGCKDDLPPLRSRRYSSKSELCSVMLGLTSAKASTICSPR
ncbi:hypothetical protein KC353_g53 [Hortaea werneckii]|nr:hypothetical protein KC353_g53 [Hortaea werneckii]